LLEIVGIQVRELSKRISAQGITLELTKQAREFLAERGYDPAYGARPLRRAIQKYLEDPIAEELLKGKYPEGSIVRVKMNKKTGDLRFVTALTEKNDGDVEEEEKSADVN
jgi:ATP-dependent Clp protease ATP-binding subunit ClpC